MWPTRYTRILGVSKKEKKKKEEENWSPLLSALREAAETDRRYRTAVDEYRAAREYLLSQHAAAAQSNHSYASSGTGSASSGTGSASSGYYTGSPGNMWRSVVTSRQVPYDEDPPEPEPSTEDRVEELEAQLAAAWEAITDLQQVIDEMTS